MLRRSLLVIPCLLLTPLASTADPPRATDPRLEVVLFAQAPEIVHPIACDFDRKGRLLVIESHTHFPPPNYKGPRHDRVRMLEDTDGDGRADRFTTVYEGMVKSMDLAVHPDGSVYLATRSEILRLRDTDDDGKADQVLRIAQLDTRGDYPHNGLSGLCFDSRGDLYFGMGENLGERYRLVGADGTVIADGGEGGNVFWVSAEGKGLRRVATGFWNPFGVGRDIFGRLFAVDNDPDAMPPCRLLHVVEGADFGYQFRYGRSGRHPFQAWDGQLLGTLPQTAGTGEAPCEVLSYESDGLPREYLGNLLVTAWADHRVERYVLKEQGASFRAERRPFVQGGEGFRPAGLATAPDGSLFITDWVRKDYELHGQGAIWHVRPRERSTPKRPADPREAMRSLHRPLREAAAHRLAADEAGRAVLRSHLGDREVRVRAAALTALIDAADAKTDLSALAESDPVVGLRAQAVRALAARGEDTTRFLGPKQPAEVRFAVVAGLKAKAALPTLLALLSDADPYLRHAAVQRLARSPELLETTRPEKLRDARQRAGLLLAHRASGRPGAERVIADFLADADEEVRFLAVKWIADRALKAYRPQVVALLNDRVLPIRMYHACATALARIDGQEVSEAKLADAFLDRATDAKASAEQRIMALRLVPATHPRLSVERLGRMLRDDNAELRLEAARALVEHPNTKKIALLLQAATDTTQPEPVRAQAVIGLSERPAELLRLTRENGAVRDEALRALTGANLSAADRASLEELARREPRTADLVARVLGRPFAADRPPLTDVAAWLKRLEGPADAAAGRRIFAHPKLALCSRCHRVDGRGQDIGPDLSSIGRRERRPILESILQPSREVAPQYQVWQIETADGKSRTGMLVRTYLDDYTYVDPQGVSFLVNTRAIVESRPLPTSLMPERLVDLLTDQELRDLLAYLESRK